MKFVPFALSVGLVGLVGAGCSPSKDIESEMKANPPVTPRAASTAGATTTTTGTTPAPPTTTGTTGTAATPPSTTTSTAGATTVKPPQAPADKTADNANRAFQLRSLQHAAVKLGGHPIDAWVMDTEPKRSEGMMFLTDKDVKADQGMIFVFDGPQPAKGAGFWMKNTILPLDIIYIGADHKVLNVQEGKPFDEKNLPPAGAYTDVVELKQGQAAKLGIKPGAAVDIPKDLKGEK